MNALWRLPGVCAVIGLGAMAPSALGAASPAGLLLVANKGDETLSIVDLASGRQVAVVPEDGNTGHEVAVSPDGRRAFVPIYASVGVGQKGVDGHLIRVVDLDRRAVVATIDFGRAVRPHCPVFGPRDGLLYVTTELEDSVTVIDPATLAIVGSIPTGRPQSHMLAITRDGRRGYTANVSSGTVSVLDLAARTLIATIPVATVTQRIALSVDDRLAFTADQTAARIIVIDTASNTVATSVPLPGIGFGTTPTPDGRWLLVAMPAISRVGVVNLVSLRVERTVDMPKSPQEIRLSPDGSEAYVSCSASGEVVVIGTRDWAIDQRITVGSADDGMALVAPR